MIFSALIDSKMYEMTTKYLNNSHKFHKTTINYRNFNLTF